MENIADDSSTYIAINYIINIHGRRCSGIQLGHREDNFIVKKGSNATTNSSNNQYVAFEPFFTIKLSSLWPHHLMLYN